MELLKSSELIKLEGASIRVDREKEGPERRMMNLRLSVPVPKGGMYTDLPAVFRRLFDGAAGGGKGEDGFKSAQVDFELKGQRMHVFATSQAKKPMAMIEFADLKSFRLFRAEEGGPVLLGLKVVFDYTNSNSQAAEWALNAIGTAFYWSCEPIQQSLPAAAAHAAPGSSTKPDRKAAAKEDATIQ